MDTIKKLQTAILSAALLGAASLAHAQTGGLTLERWTGVTGTSMSALQTVVGSRAPNTTVVQYGPAEIAQTSPNMDNFAARLRGTLMVPYDGEYTFFVSGDDDVALWFSKDASRFNKERIAYNTGYTALRNCKQNASQRSRMFNLKAGQSYYIEGLQKEGGGQDHLSIGWTYGTAPTYTQAALGAVTQTWTPQADGSVQLSVDGGDITSTADNSGFYYRNWTGNGDFIARVSGMTVPHSYVKTGLMLRTGTDAGAQMVSIVQTSGGNMIFQRRATAGASLSNTTYTGTFQWVKLHRDGDVVTAYVSLDGKAWFSPGNVTITGLATNILVGICATDGTATGHVPVTATVSDMQAVPFDAVEVIPAQYLSANTPDPADVNDDGLPDAWQTANGLNGTTLQAGSGQFGDPDGDGLTNFEEYKRGLNPTIPNRVPGGLAFQLWLNTAYYNVSELVRDAHFLSLADSVGLTSGIEVRDLPVYSGSRGRGYLTVPVSGTYRFWVTGADGVELWLSTDSTKYRKRKLCGFGADEGAGNGIDPGTNPYTVWDKFSAQLSDPVTLVAGQKYFIEILCTSTHSGAGWFSAAWARDGGVREPIPAQYLESYIMEAEDADDDYLPDWWERQYGLNPGDNGLTDPAKQGEYGDFDGDGLTNRMEFVLGTNPANADTDGDGVSDYDEVMFYKTSPTVSNLIQQVLAADVALTSYNAGNTSGTWQIFDGGLMGSVFRGHIEWNFTVPADGWWMVNITGRLRGSLRAQESVPINVQVDGMALAPQVMNFEGGNPAALKVVTPWLAAGTHRILLDVDNDIGRRTLQILSVNIFSNGGFDADGNGRADWLDAILANTNSLAPGPTDSVVSPGFIEGSVRYTGGVTIASSGQAVTPQRGLGDLHWFANVLLSPTGSTTVTALFENGTIPQNRSINWTAWNASGGVNLTVRVGDSVKIGASLGATDTGTASITVAGTAHPGIAAVGGYFVQTFATAGSYTVSTTHSNGTKKTATILVVGADFGSQQAFYADWATWRTFSTVSNALWVDAEPSLVISARQASGSGQALELLASRSGSHTLAARISTGGPIVNLGAVNTVGISDALKNDAAQYVGSTVDGYRILRSPIMVSELPPGGRVVITIFRAGVTFLDGTTVMTLTASDFVEGVAYLDFRYPAGMTGGYCHYIDVYDGQNRYLGRH